MGKKIIIAIDVITGIIVIFLLLNTLQKEVIHIQFENIPSGISFESWLFLAGSILLILINIFHFYSYLKNKNITEK